MGKAYLLDCTLRDGGYVNDWQFGEETIKGFGKKITQTGIDIYEIGFITGDTYDKNRAVFPNIELITDMIQPKNPNLMYVGMLDMGAPVPIERLVPYDGTSVDGLRVIFKKNKLEEAYEYCKKVKELGYILFVQFVGTDKYSDKEFIEAIEKFNQLIPFAVSIVDTFGMIKRKQFLRLVYLADNNLGKSIVLGYHAHNNLQQAFGNAEALVEMNLQRDICVDACVFGMGRGAGNLNLELFAEYMNENFGTQYRIEPMLEIMDEYLNDIYKDKFWGYSLPLYLSATNGCHPNYAIYLAEKDSLTVKSFNELLQGISEKEKAEFSKSNAERYYKEYQEYFIDEKETILELSKAMAGRDVLILAPGRTLADYKDSIDNLINVKNPIVVAVNFTSSEFKIDYVFSSNMRRYVKIQGRTKAKCIITSNMKDALSYNYMVNFSKYSSIMPEIIDNSGLMALRLMLALGVNNVFVAGMDGYTTLTDQNYFDQMLEYDFSKEAEKRNTLISAEIKSLSKKMNIQFITPTCYKISQLTFKKEGERNIV